MIAPAWLLIFLASLITSARIRLSAVIFGQPVSVSLLDVIAALLGLALLALVLLLARTVIAERGFPVPRTAT